MSLRPEAKQAISQSFGSVLADQMAITHFHDGVWSPAEIQPLQPLSLHPASHVLHYASTCFEGLKVHRQVTGDCFIFRLDDHIRRLQNSASMLCLPKPDYAMTESMILDLATRCKDWIPETPGSLYLRPTLIGTSANIGSAAKPTKEACFYILAAPVGDYFRSGPKPLTVVIDDENMRTAPHFGAAKTGGNYASALSHIVRNEEQHDAHQVLFAPGGIVQETAAANFLLINDHQILTKSLDASFLHGITRDSILKLARRFGYRVEERELTVKETLNWLKTGEAVLSGTAAVLSGIGTMIYRGERRQVGDGSLGPNTLRLRGALLNIQAGNEPDVFDWLRSV